MKYRHEWKHEITQLDRLSLLARLPHVMKYDSHAIDGTYRIRSLYFDSDSDKALREKVDGINIREKFRIRFYNGDTSRIALEKKGKVNGLCTKDMCLITKEEAQAIVDGDIDWMLDSGRPLCVELYAKMRFLGLKPKTIVDYTRDPFILKQGHVRVTMDHHIRTGIRCTDFLNPDSVTIPAGDEHIILEVKWDEYLPDIIRDAVSLPGRRVCAFSKYEQCRIYG